MPIPKPPRKPETIGSPMSSIPIPSITGGAAGPSQSGPVGGSDRFGNFILGSSGNTSGSPESGITGAFKTTGFQVMLVGFAVLAGAILWKRL
mgnify:CR=1 FL=1